MPGTTGDGAARRIPLWIIGGIKDTGKIALMALRGNGLTMVSQSGENKAVKNLRGLQLH
jgi:hypothetical protein